MISHLFLNVFDVFFPSFFTYSFWVLVISFRLCLVSITKIFCKLRSDFLDFSNAIFGFFPSNWRQSNFFFGYLNWLFELFCRSIFVSPVTLLFLFTTPLFYSIFLNEPFSLTNLPSTLRPSARAFFSPLDLTFQSAGLSHFWIFEPL